MFFFFAHALRCAHRLFSLFLPAAPSLSHSLTGPVVTADVISTFVARVQPVPPALPRHYYSHSGPGRNKATWELSAFQSETLHQRSAGALPVRCGAPRRSGIGSPDDLIQLAASFYTSQLFVMSGCVNLLQNELEFQGSWS